MDAIRTEDRLLTYCARTRLSPAWQEKINQSLGQDLDWDYFLRAAVNHGVAALCFAQLRAAPPGRIPREAAERLREHARKVAAHNLYLGAKLAGLIRAFRSRGICAIPFKGPVLAVMAYRDLAAREFVDLDLVLCQRELPQAWALLRAEGYKPEENLPPAEEPHGAAGQYAFVSPSGDFLVELHTERTLRHFPRPLEPERLARSLAPIELSGESLLTFSPEETLVFLSVHGAKDFWARLLWVADVAELVQLPQGLDWASALTAAHELGCGRLVRLALLLAHSLLDAPLPAEVLAQAQADRAAQALAHKVSRWLFSGKPPGFPDRLRFRMRMVEGFWPGARYACRLATAPVAEDRETVRLPAGLAFLYRLLRPLRLLAGRDRR